MNALHKHIRALLAKRWSGAVIAAVGVAVAGLGVAAVNGGGASRAVVQTPPDYLTTTYASSGLPGFRLSVQTSTVSPTSLDLATYYGSPTSPAAPTRSARIDTLARALENDPDRIYQFVRNTIAFEPQFGLHKGADGVLLDSSGGAFDQSQLMIDLLRAAGVSARYVYGTVNLGSEASTIFRVNDARQACILLAVGGVPATVNSQTDCSALSGSITAVQMRHVWVEANLGGTWYAFDPSLKTNTQITGIDIWAAAGTNATAAWNNVSSGVSISGGDLNGVNGPAIQAKLATYATTLQGALSASHSNKSLKQVAGGWEIVRTEDAPRNTTLPGQVSIDTRWANDVPTPYRATLRVQTAGFDQTLDLPSIYGWRVQAQLQVRSLKLAVRKQDHLDGEHTAYFVSGSCDNVVLYCGSDPGQSAFDAQARRMDLSINHPYVARANTSSALGTFADETVAKSIEIGKRVDILARTAGGDGGRKARWAASMDPIQQHRIVPSGDDYNNCYANDDGSPTQPGECDGHSAVDWRYYVQDTLPNVGSQFLLFPRGEVAVAEMGTKKDFLLNTWTDLFDRTTAVMEGLSGARIFHQHSIGIGLTPSAVENILDIDTAVGIAPGGADQPHQILAALAPLALTEEALAVGQMAVERPMFQGSPIQTTAARRMTSGAGLKVLTTPGSTSGLSANVTADTKARIEAYLTAGFSVVTNTTANENAFLARRSDGSEQAWILRSAFQGQTPDVDPRVAFRKGAESQTPKPTDFLGNAESRQIAANVASSLLGAVDLRMGTLSFGEGNEITMGQGDFPYTLAFSRSYVSTGPVEGDSALGMGWTHNWESSVSNSMDVNVLLPDAEVVTSSPMLIAALVALQAGRADTIEASVVSGVALDWLQDRASYNIKTVNGGGRTGRFVKLADGSWRNPASPTETIAQYGGGPFLTQVDWTLADKSVMRFRDITNPFSGSTSMGRAGALTEWVMPTGVTITLTYGDTDATNRPALVSVTNNLGAALSFTNSKNPTQEVTDTCYAQAGTTYPNFASGYWEAMQLCYEQSTVGGQLLQVKAGADEINFYYDRFCPRFVNYCTSQLNAAARPGLRTRRYIYATPTGALAGAVAPMEYQQVLARVDDDGAPTSRARWVWNAVGGQVAPYVAEAYDAQNRKTTYYSSTLTASSAKDATDAVVRQAYDTDGRLIASADGLGRTARATYDGVGRTASVQTPWGDSTAFTFDAKGNLTQRVQTPKAGCTSGLNAQEQAWWCQTITITAEYDSYWNKPTKITLPATAQDPSTRDWLLTYNAKGLVETMTGPSVPNGTSGSNANPVWTTWYDAYGRVTQTEDPTGRRSTMTWGGGGLPAFCQRLSTVSTQSGGLNLTTTMACDAMGNVTSVTDPRGHTTTTSYDALRRKTGSIGPSGTLIQSELVYDLNGDLTQERHWDNTVSLWRTTTTTWSATRKPLTVTNPSGHVTRTCYDAVDRAIAVIDGERRARVTSYNAAGQPTEVRGWLRANPGACTWSSELPSGQTEDRWRRYQYNAAGLQSAELDARGNAIQQTYDGLGRPMKTIYADASEEWTAQDQRGNVIMRRKRGGDRVAVYYDAMGRDYQVREFLAADAGVTWKGRNSRAFYDLAGRPVRRDVSTQTSTNGVFDPALTRDVRIYGYDAAGRLTNDQWQPDGTASGPTLSLAYGYDNAGNRTTITWPGSWTATYGFDAVNRVNSVSFPGNGGTQTVAITHDSLSRRSGVNRPGSAADTAYTYEPDNDLATLGHAFTAGGAAGAVTFTYGRDASSKITSLAWSQPSFGWTPPVGYSRSYGTANVLNQIPSEGGTAISWNTDGNMTSDGTTTFTWTYGNRMSGAGRSGMTATYDYDSDDRRTKKTVNGTVTRTMWSGADEVAELDAAGNILRRFVPDGTGGMDARLATVEAAGTVAWHHTDHLGSVIATSNASGQVTALATYSPYGEFGSGVTAPPAGSPFGYTGRQFDAETGLYQYRARYYSPRLGRFLSTDPVGTKDDPNLYLYVQNDPVNATDPTGMFELVISGPERFQRRVEAHIRWIESGPNGAALVQAIRDSPMTVTIEPSTDRQNHTCCVSTTEGVMLPARDATISYNPSQEIGGEDSRGNARRPAAVGLAHELGHAEQIIAGEHPPRVGPTPQPGETPQHEQNSVRRENEVRREHRIREREAYVPN